MKISHELKKIFYFITNFVLTTKEDIDFAVGGQAVIEGVMMRSPNSVVVAVRKKDNSIKISAKNHKSIIQKYKFLNIPIVRGIVGLIEMMSIGMTAINFSANESIEEEEEIKANEESKKEEKKSLSMKIFETGMFVFSIVLALAVSVFMFKFVPLWITTILDGQFAYIHDNFIIFNLIDGVIKLSIFLAYIYILSLVPSFRRIFEYHGAEHKSIFTYEKHLDLNVHNAKPQSRFHPRCGTSFILIVFVLSILVYTFVPKQEIFWQNLGLRLAALPLIAGLAYEFLKFSAKYRESKWVNIFVAPGLALQKITTKEPTDSQLEVGLTSLKESLEIEKAAQS
jgi:uncharacterized protein YqhQ